MICLTCYINGPFLPPCLSSFPDRWQTTLFKELLGTIISVWNVSWGLTDCFSLRASRNPQHRFFFFFSSTPPQCSEWLIWWSFYREDHVRFKRWFQAHSSPVSFDGPFLAESCCVFTHSVNTRLNLGLESEMVSFLFLYKCMNPRMIS